MNGPLPHPKNDRGAFERAFTSVKGGRKVTFAVYARL